ncbi:MAG TPA: GNAT family N-acetyltransferase [Acidimicrobiia bacterium]|nr:GNAT family N-acetyltransferase [Acidimicrobiia bacterium]
MTSTELGGADIVLTADTEHLVPTIVMAFAADPFVRWMLPSPEQYLEHFTRITRLHGARTGATGGAWARTDGRSVAFWYPPGVHPDAAALGAEFTAAGVADRVAAVWDAAAQYELDEPHWYLRQIGVDPVLQRGGHGSALLRAGLAEIDRRGEPAYLEATTPGSRDLYARFGFEARAEIRVGDSAPLWPMARPAR